MRDAARHIALLVAFLALTAQGALAHKINVFATAEGETVSGEVYVDASTPVAGAPVRLYIDPEATPVHRTKTDADGRFSFRATCRADLHIVCETGDGHRAEWIVRASELPESLPPCEDAGLPATATAAPQADSPPQTPPDEQALRSIVEQAVARQVAPLRKELRAYEEKVRLRDIFGAIGYIVGIFGLAALAATRRAGRKG